jgi:hypothetical protein
LLGVGGNPKMLLLEKCELPFQKKGQSRQKKQSDDELLMTKVREFRKWKRAKGTIRSEEWVG